MLRAPRRDDGFTLIELVVSIAILGVVMVAITGAMVVGMRSDKETDTRLDESRDVQFASTWFGDDVQSANRIAEGGPTNCGSDPSANVVLRFANTDLTTPPALPPTETPNDALKVSYVLRSATGGATELHRMACTLAADGVSVIRKTDDIVARSLSAIAPAVACLPSPCAAARTVTLTLTGRPPTPADTPLSYTLRGTRRSS